MRSLKLLFAGAVLAVPLSLALAPVPNASGLLGAGDTVTVLNTPANPVPVVGQVTTTPPLPATLVHNTILTSDSGSNFVLLGPDPAGTRYAITSLNYGNIGGSIEEMSLEVV